MNDTTPTTIDGICTEHTITSVAASDYPELIEQAQQLAVEQRIFEARQTEIREAQAIIDRLIQRKDYLLDGADTRSKRREIDRIDRRINELWHTINYEG